MSGRAILVLGLVGVGIYVLKRGEAAASAMQGLGADPTQADIDARQAQGQAMINAINAIPVPNPVLPLLGPRPWQQVLGVPT